jgi:serine/threonine protein kinase
MFFAEMLKGLNRLSEVGLFHGDLKLQNTVLGLGDNKAKIMDLGLAGNVGISTSHLVSFSIEALGGTFPPPEVIKVRAMAANISEIDLSKIDIFAWGAEFVELITATFFSERVMYRPDHNNLNYDPLHKIVVQDRNRVASMCPPHQVFKFIEDVYRVTALLRTSGDRQHALLATLIDGCIDPDPKTRITTTEAFGQLMVIIHA